MEKSVNLILLLVGLLSAICQGVEVDETFEFQGHRSGIYLRNASRTNNADLVVYMFEKLNEKIGAYGFFRSKYNPDIAHRNRNMMLEAIYSKIRENEQQTNIDWKSFFETEFVKIENMVKEYVSEQKPEVMPQFGISVVIVDGNVATEARSFPGDKTATSNGASSSTNQDKTIWEVDSDSTRALLIQTSFNINQEIEKVLGPIIDQIQNWKEVPQMVYRLGVETSEGRRTSGLIIIDLKSPH